MKFTTVNEIPVRSAQKDIAKFIEDFVRKEVPFARVEYTEKDYISAVSCSGSLRKSAKRLHINVTTVVRDKDVYLINLNLINKDD